MKRCRQLSSTGVILRPVGLSDVVFALCTLTAVLGICAGRITSSVPVSPSMVKHGESPADSIDLKCPDETFDHFTGPTSCRLVCPPHKTTDANIRFCSSNCPRMYKCLLEVIPFRVTNGSAETTSELPVTCRGGFFYHVLFRAFFNCTQVCRNDTAFCRTNCPDSAVCAFGANGSLIIRSTTDAGRLTASTTESASRGTMTDTSLSIPKDSGTFTESPMPSPAAVHNRNETSYILAGVSIFLFVLLIILIVVIIRLCCWQQFGGLLDRVFRCPQNPHQQDLPAAAGAPNVEVQPLNDAERPPDEEVDYEADGVSEDIPLHNLQPGPVEHDEELAERPDDGGLSSNMINSIQAIQESQMPSSELQPGRTKTGQLLTQPADATEDPSGNHETFRKTNHCSDGS